MRRRLPALVFILALLFAGALSPPRVEAAGLSDLPGTLHSYLAAALDFVAGLFDAPPASVPAQPAAVANSQSNAQQGSSAPSPASIAPAPAPPTTTRIVYQY